MLPEPGTAHVFLASPGALLAAARSHPSWLSEGERARAARTRAPEGRDGYLATRVLVRGVLARTLGRSPRELTFVENAHGRPSLEPPAEGVDFNASRSPAWVALVLTRGTACGIDVEDLQRRAGVDTVARAFAPEERALLDRAPASERRRVFFELWTLKEAFLKARGTGIAGGLDACAFALVPGAPPRLSLPASAGEDARGWSFLHLQPDERHLVAVAVRSPAAPRLIVHGEGETCRMVEVPAPFR